MAHALEMRTPTSGKVGAAVMSKEVALDTYRSRVIGATDFAALVVARRYRLSVPLAKVVCEHG
jgi:hypothetical protein